MCKIGTMTGMLILALLLAGCGNNETNDAGGVSQTERISATVIGISKDGSVTETIIEDFTADYYEEEALRSAVLSEAAQFNQGEETDISVDKFEIENGVVTIVMKYPSADVYTRYNSNPYEEKKLFCGTVKEAYDAGYPLDVTLKSVRNEEEQIGKEELLGMGERHIFIAGSPMEVQLYGKIQYAGGGITVKGKNKAVLNAGEAGEGLGEYYLVFK